MVCHTHPLGTAKIPRQPNAHIIPAFALACCGLFCVPPALYKCSSRFLNGFLHAHLSGTMILLQSSRCRAFTGRRGYPGSIPCKRPAGHGRSVMCHLAVVRLTQRSSSEALRGAKPPTKLAWSFPPQMVLRFHGKLVAAHGELPPQHSQMAKFAPKPAA